MNRTATLNAFAALVLAYLVGSFVVWDMNPAHWGADWRFAIALSGLSAAALLGAIGSVRR